MAVLLRPKRWNAVPPPGAVVDPGHPLGRDMRIGWVFVNSVAGATGGFNMPSVPGTEVQASWATSASLPISGDGLNPTGLRLVGTTSDTGQPEFTTAAPPRCRVGVGTLMFKGRFLGDALRGAAGGSVRLWGIDPHTTDTSPFNGFNISRAGAQLNVLVSSGSNLSYSGLSSADYGKPIQVVATTNTRGSWLYVGPNVVASQTGTDGSITGLGTDAVLRLGGYAQQSTFKINAEYEAVWLWGRALTSDEVAWLAAEPYAMLQTPKPLSRATTTGLRLGVQRRVRQSRSPQKPPLGAQVNWGHSLAQGLVGAWLFNEQGGAKVQNLAGPLQGSLLNTYAWSPEGVEMSTDTGTTGRTNLGDIRVTGDMTVLCSYTPLRLSGSFDVGVISKYDSGARPANCEWVLGGNLFASSGDSRQFFGISSGTTLAIAGSASGDVAVVGRRDVLVGTRRGTALTVYRNGKVIGTATGPSGAINTGTGRVVKLGEIDNGAGNNSNSRYHYAYLWNRALNQDEINQLYSDPYAFLQPASRLLPTSQLDFPDSLPLPQQGIIGGWWKADAITPQADNSALTSWPTSAGAAGAAATSGSTPPTYRTASGPNRMPCVDFDGSGQRMLTAGNLGIVTMFVVAKARTDATAAGRIIDSPGSFRTLIQVNSSTNGRLSVFEAPGTFGTANPNVSRDLRDSWHIFTAQFGSVLRVWVDGILEYNNNVTGFSGNFNQLIFGSDSAGSNLKGSIAEVLVYIGGMVDGDRDTVNSILAAKYSLPMSYSRFGAYRDLTRQAVQRAAVI